MIRKHLILTGLSLLLTLLLFQATPWDFQIQDLLYDQAMRHWWLRKDDGFTRLIFYDGIKGVLMLIFVALLGALALSKRWALSAQQKCALVIAVLGMMVVPLAVNLLKDHTNMACPKNLTRYGGDVHYIHLFDQYTDANRPATDNRCFPSGHASGGFSLLALVFLFRERKRRMQVIGAALITGWVMGIYKMLIGDHFLSHVLISMELSWLLVCLTAMSVRRQKSLVVLSASES